MFSREAKYKYKPRELPHIELFEAEDEYRMNEGELPEGEAPKSNTCFSAF